MVKRLELIEHCTIDDEVDFFSIWQHNTGELLIITPPEPTKENGLLAVLSEKDRGLEKLADLIEEEHRVQYFNTRPLYIIWEDKNQVHEYAPFENGVRQLRKVY